MKKILLTLLMAFLATAGVLADTTYELVTDDSTLADGDKIIIVSSNNGIYYAMSTEQKSNNRGAVSVTVKDYTIAVPDNAPSDGSHIPQVVTLKYDTNVSSFNWRLTIDDENGSTKYLGNTYSGTSTKNQNYLALSNSVTNGVSAEITISSSNDAEIKFDQVLSKTYTVRFNYNNGSPLFASYTTGQSAVQIYREQQLNPTKVTLDPLNSDGNFEVNVGDEPFCPVTVYDEEIENEVTGAYDLLKYTITTGDLSGLTFSNGKITAVKPGYYKVKVEPDGKKYVLVDDFDPEIIDLYVYRPLTLTAIEKDINIPLYDSRTPVTLNLPDLWDKVDVDVQTYSGPEDGLEISGNIIKALHAGEWIVTYKQKDTYYPIDPGTELVVTVNKIMPTIEWRKDGELASAFTAQCEVTKQEEFPKAVFSINDPALPLEYIIMNDASNEDEIATIDENTGEITLIGEGVVTVGASYTLSDSLADKYNKNDYAAVDAEYELTVLPKPLFEHFTFTPAPDEEGVIHLKAGESFAAYNATEGLDKIEYKLNKDGSYTDYTLGDALTPDYPGKSSKDWYFKATKDGNEFEESVKVSCTRYGIKASFEEKSKSINLTDYKRGEAQTVEIPEVKLEGTTDLYIPEITYALQEGENIATLNEDGTLTITGEGTVKVAANVDTECEDYNFYYNAFTAPVFTVNVTAKKADLKVAFAETAKEVNLNDNDGDPITITLPKLSIEGSNEFYAPEISYALVDEDGIATLENGKLTLNETGDVTVKAVVDITTDDFKFYYNDIEAMPTFDVHVINQEKPLVATFDFVNEDFGFTLIANSENEKSVKHIYCKNNPNIRLDFGGNYRLYGTEDAHDMRIGANGTLKVSVADSTGKIIHDYSILAINFDHATSYYLTHDDTTVGGGNYSTGKSMASWEIAKNQDKVYEVDFKREANTIRIKSITVTLAKAPMSANLTLPATFSYNHIHYDADYKHDADSYDFDSELGRHVNYRDAYKEISLLEKGQLFCEPEAVKKVKATLEPLFTPKYTCKEDLNSEDQKLYDDYRHFVDHKIYEDPKVELASEDELDLWIKSAGIYRLTLSIEGSDKWIADSKSCDLYIIPNLTQSLSFSHAASEDNGQTWQLSVGEDEITKHKETYPDATDEDAIKAILSHVMIDTHYGEDELYYQVIYNEEDEDVAEDEQTEVAPNVAYRVARAAVAAPEGYSKYNAQGINLYNAKTLNLYLNENGIETYVINGINFMSNVATDIEKILEEGAANGEAIYFDLNGHCVSPDAKGFKIRVADGVGVLLLEK